MAGSFSDPSPVHGFPVGWWSWRTRILPFVDQGPMHAAMDSLNEDSIAGMDTYHSHLANPPTLFACPSDPHSTAKYTEHFPWTAGPISLGVSNYFGVRGSTAADPNLGEKPDGIFPERNVGIKSRDITDGTSNTLMLGERPADRDAYWGWWAIGTGQDGHGMADFVLHCEEGLRPGVLGSADDLNHFWSPHDGGALFLLGDGAVQFLSYSVDFGTFQSLGSRNLGEVIGEF